MVRVYGLYCTVLYCTVLYCTVSVLFLESQQEVSFYIIISIVNGVYVGKPLESLLYIGKPIEKVCFT